MTTPSVLLAIPNRGTITKHLAAYIVRVKRDSVDLAFPQFFPVEHGRNTTVKNFLGGSWDFLLMIDDDNPPMRDPLEMVELDLDIVAGVTPTWQITAEQIRTGQYPITYCVFDEDKRVNSYREHMPRDGLQEVDAVGTGCILIARRVLERMKAAGLPPFERYWDEDGICTRGSDITFCEKAKQLGFKVWAHYDYPCRHFKTLDVETVREVMGGRDITHANGPNINTPQYWDAEWETREARDYPFYTEIVERCQGSMSVLDFGCGRGDLLAELDKVVPDAWGVDFSEKAVQICHDRGLKASVGEFPLKRHWDVIVATEVLEHVDDPQAMLEHFFEFTDRVIYAVPHNFLPPGIEPEHRRVFYESYCREITPFVKGVELVDKYLLVEAQRAG